MAQLISHRPFIAKTHVRSQASACDFCGWLIDTGIGFSLKSFGFPFSLSFHACFILVFFYMLRLPEEKTDEAWRTSKEHSLWKREALVRSFSFFFWVVSPLTLSLTFLPNFHPLSSKTWYHVSCSPDIHRSVSKESVDKISVCVNSTFSRVVKTECGRNLGGQALAVQPTPSLPCQFLALNSASCPISQLLRIANFFVEDIVYSSRWKRSRSLSWV